MFFLLGLSNFWVGAWFPFNFNEGQFIEQYEYAFDIYRMKESGELFEDSEFPNDETSLNLNDDKVTEEQREQLSNVEWVSFFIQNKTDRIDRRQIYLQIQPK